jgi:hypothetical protein
MSISAVLLCKISGNGRGREQRYKNLLGKRVEARYRTAYIYHCATGTLAIDNGVSVFIEDHFTQNGKQKMLRVEIPYEYILTVIELPPGPAPHP